ncbi:MAG: methyl-accepting chemotaxis protein [Candidatus Hydrogenedentales bacterium]|jgi:methyl-accepting chemotaxis protein
MKTWTIGKKLVISFSVVAAITLLQGLAGYYEATVSEGTIKEIGQVRLPSLQSILVISEAQTAVDAAENALLSRDIDLKTRQEKYGAFEAAWKRAEDAWNVYEPLPQTPEEAEAWKDFVPAWEAWKKDHQDYVALCLEYDKTVEAQAKGDERYAKMSNQALVVNPASFSSAEALLNKIVELYRAKADDPQAAYTQVDVLTVHSLLVISEAQTAIDSSENALLARNSDMTGRQVAYDRITAAWQRVEDAWKVYEPLPQLPEESQLWKEFVPAWNAWKADHEAFMALSKDYDTTVEDYLRSNDLYEKMTTQALVTNALTFSAAEQYMNTLVDVNRRKSDAEVQNTAWLKTASLVAMILGVVTALLLGLLISRSINKALSRIAASIGTGADQTASAAGQVAQSSQSMAEGVSEQASSLEETSASLEEMTSMTRQNADNATQAMGMMNTAREIVEGMAQGTDEMMKAISEIKVSADQTAKIVKTIDEIAFQTNLLALNAAVEAARAGDAGKGFAVVAEEVRNLAQRSAEAAKNTAAMIEGSVKNAERGVQVTERVAESVQQTVASSGKVSQLVTEIAAASKEQAQGIDQINTAVAQMDKVTQANAANAEESASASEELSAQASEMNRMVGELLAMVGGANGNGALPTKAVPELSNRRSPRKALVAQSAHASAAIERRVANPTHVIPLDDEDLKDF